MTNIQHAIRLCRLGYDTNDNSYYARIDELLALEEQTDQIVSCRKMAEVGPSLISLRFAYPHIMSILEEIQEIS